MYDNVLAEKIAKQYKEKPFTDFASIGPETLLEKLNLNWRERDLPEIVRTKHVHRLHPYMGKFIPQLVEIFLRKFRPSMHQINNSTETTLVKLLFSSLCPGSKELEKLMEEFR